MMYDWAETRTASWLGTMGLSNKLNCVCLTDLDPRDRPIKITWLMFYNSAEEALKGLATILNLPPAP